MKNRIQKNFDLLLNSIIICLLFNFANFSTLYAQDTVYYDNNHNVVDSLSCANSYRVINSFKDHQIIEEYQTSGRLKSLKQNVISEGKTVLHGIHKVWYESGHLESYKSYIGGKLNGQIKSYWEDGQIKSFEVFSNDSLECGTYWNQKGDEIRSFPDSLGAILIYHQILLCKAKRIEELTEVWDTIYFDKFNKVVSNSDSSEYYRIELKDGDLMTRKEFYSSGLQKSSSTFALFNKYKLLNGASQDWYRNGQLKNDISYKVGRLHGNIKTYWSNGKMKRFDIYHEGILKKGKCWDEEGNEIKYISQKLVPAFKKGGEKGLSSYLSKKLKYPYYCVSNRIQGLVVIQFTVKADGTLENITVKESADKYLDKEALRIVANMPKWIPAENNGIPIDAPYVLPVNFLLP